MLPNNQDIEKSVLGCLLMGKQDYIISLAEKDFFWDISKLIYNSMRELYDLKAPIDEFTVSDLMKDSIDNSLSIVAGLESYVSTPENIEHYIKLLQTYTMRREVIKASLKVKELAENEFYETPLDLKADAMQAFDIKVYDGQKKNNSLSSVLTAVMIDCEEKANAKQEDRLFTGFYDLDKITAGLHPEELTIIAARPGVGKTAFAIQLALYLAKKDNCILCVSREMSNLQIGKRILANLATVDGQRLRLCKTLRDEDWAKMNDALSEASEFQIELNDNLSSIQEIRAYCRELKNKGKLDVLIIDYLQLCRSQKKAENRRQEIEDISRQLKEMSLEFGIPVISLSQLSRDNAKNNREPELHDLRESGAIEQDADNVIFLHVPADTDETQECFDIKVIVGKQRNGPTGYIWLRYYRRTFKLCNKTY